MNKGPAYIKILDDGNIRTSGPRHTIPWQVLAEIVKEKDPLLGDQEVIVQFAMTQEGVTYYIESQQF